MAKKTPAQLEREVNEALSTPPATQAVRPSQPKQIPVPGTSGYISVSAEQPTGRQTMGGQAVTKCTATLVLNGSVVHTAEGDSQSKAVANVSLWLDGMSRTISHIATKMRLR